MSCNVDLLHIGIWTFYSGASLLLASVISYSQLSPLEKDDLLKERNKIRQSNIAKQISTPSPQIVSSAQKRKMNFLV